MSKVCRYRPYVVRKLSHISSGILIFPQICLYFSYIVRKLNMSKQQFMDLIPGLPVSSIIMLSGSLACPKSIGIFHILSGSLTCPKSVGIVHMLSGSYQVSSLSVSSRCCQEANKSQVCRYCPDVVRKLTSFTSVCIVHISSGILTCLNSVSICHILSGILTCPKIVDIFHMSSGILTCPKFVSIFHCRQKS